MLMDYRLTDPDKERSCSHMKFLSKKYSALHFILILFFAFPAEAYAYIDLGSGSYLIQAIIALALGMLFTIKLYFRKFIDIFKKKKNKH
jgi:hypothetical protein